MEPQLLHGFRAASAGHVNAQGTADEPLPACQQAATAAAPSRRGTASFDKEERMGDLAIDFDGVKVVVDPVSVGYLRGTVVDYVSGLNGTGFQFKNPNAKRTCGCGSSFS